MEMMPKRVSHGGTYAGNRIAAAAATRTLGILRDTDALETIERTGLAMQTALSRSSTGGACPTCSRASPRCSA